MFNPIPRTTITQAVENEQDFQYLSGMTNTDTIAAIGRQLGAKYVVAGNITALGSNKLLVISIMNIDNLRQIAGDFQTYTNIEEIQGKLPGMAEKIIAAVEASVEESLPKLAVVPVSVQDNVDRRTADTLAQILAIYLIRSGKYAVYPRTSSLEQVRNEYETQASVTDEKNVISIGKGTNPRQVLSVAARRLGSATMFNAAIIDLVSGSQVAGTSVGYGSMDEGIKVMETLAASLTGGKLAEEPAAPKGGSQAARNLGAGTLNIVLGLGSFIQGDWGGGLTLVAGYGAAAGLLAWELMLDYDNPLAGTPGTIALGVAGATIVYGFIRPFIYNRNKKVAMLLDRVNVAVDPAAGARTFSLSYGIRF